MISRRSLLGLTFSGAVAGVLPSSSGAGQGESKAVEVNPPAAPPLRITIGQTSQACKVELAGVDVSRMCTGARIVAEVGSLTRLQLDMIVAAGSEIVAEPGALDLQVRDLRRHLRFEADSVRVKADV